MDSKEKTFGPRPVPRPTEFEAWAPGALPSGQLAFMRAIQEKFLGAFALGLATRLESAVTAHLADPQTLARDAFLQSGQDGGCVLTLDAEPVPGQVLVELSAGLSAYLLRVFLCAPPTAEGPRAVTEIELCILREVFESLVRDMSAAWQVAGISFRLTATGAGEAVSDQDSMLVFECRLDLGEAQETFRVAVPTFLARMAALQSAPAAAQEAPALVRETILNALRRANVSVEAVLSSASLRMGDLLAMEPGHVLLLAQPAGSPVECRVGGKPKFQGEWVRHGNRQALVLL